MNSQRYWPMKLREVPFDDSHDIRRASVQGDHNGVHDDDFNVDEDTPQSHDGQV
jgi:hypothetical protein